MAVAEPHAGPGRHAAPGLANIHPGRGQGPGPGPAGGPGRRVIEDVEAGQVSGEQDGEGGLGKADPLLHQHELLAAPSRRPGAR